MNIISLANILKNMRIMNTDLKQKDIAKKMSIAPNTISSYERGNSEPDFETIYKYAQICNYEFKLYNRQTGELLSLEKMSREL